MHYKQIMKAYPDAKVGPSFVNHLLTWCVFLSIGCVVCERPKDMVHLRLHIHLPNWFSSKVICLKNMNVQKYYVICQDFSWRSTQLQGGLLNRSYKSKVDKIMFQDWKTAHNLLHPQIDRRRPSAHQMIDVMDSKPLQGCKLSFKGIVQCRVA